MIVQERVVTQDATIQYGKGAPCLLEMHQIIITQPSHPFTTPERISEAWDSSMRDVFTEEASTSVELLRNLSVLVTRVYSSSKLGLLVVKMTSQKITKHLRPVTLNLWLKSWRLL